MRSEKKERPFDSRRLLRSYKKGVAFEKQGRMNEWPGTQELKRGPLLSPHGLHQTWSLWDELLVDKVRLDARESMRRSGEKNTFNFLLQALYITRVGETKTRPPAGEAVIGIRQRGEEGGWGGGGGWVEVLQAVDAGGCVELDLLLLGAGCHRESWKPSQRRKFRENTIGNCLTLYYHIRTFTRNARSTLTHVSCAAASLINPKAPGVLFHFSALFFSIIATFESSARLHSSSPRWWRQCVMCFLYCL